MKSMLGMSLVIVVKAAIIVGFSMRPLNIVRKLIFYLKCLCLGTLDALNRGLM